MLPCSGTVRYHSAKQIVNVRKYPFYEIGADDSYYGKAIYGSILCLYVYVIHGIMHARVYIVPVTSYR